MKFKASSSTRSQHAVDAVLSQLPPDDAIVLDERPADVADAVRKLHAGDGSAATALLQTSRETRDWQHRDWLVLRIAEFSIDSPQWLDGWLAAEPANPDALLLHAQRSIIAVWRARAYAESLPSSPQQFEAFFGWLGAAQAPIEAAVAANPGDPVPWVLALAHAREDKATPNEVQTLLRLGKECCADHMGLHQAAMQYFSKKWSGTHDQMFAFTERVVSDAPVESPLHLLPLDAALEFIVAEGPARVRETGRNYVETAVQRADIWLARYDDGGAHAERAKNAVPLVLQMMHRFDHAMSAYGRVGQFVTSSPWDYFDEPRAKFIEMRTACATVVASKSPA